MGDRARMIAGRDRDHAPGALRIAQLQQPVGRTPELESAGRLQVVELEMDAPPEPSAQRLGAHERRPAHQGRDCLARLPDHPLRDRRHQGDP
jgi:hypothetical protein